MIHFFALLRNDNNPIRRIPLEQAVEADVKALFISHHNEFFNDDMIIEPFEAGYTPQEDTISFVEILLSEEFNDIPNNTNVYNELDRNNEISSVKVIFIYDENTENYYFQNFDL